MWIFTFLHLKHSSFDNIKEINCHYCLGPNWPGGPIKGVIRKTSNCTYREVVQLREINLEIKGLNKKSFLEFEFGTQEYCDVNKKAHS